MTVTIGVVTVAVVCVGVATVTVATGVLTVAVAATVGMGRVAGGGSVEGMSDGAVRLVDSGAPAVGAASVGPCGEEAAAPLLEPLTVARP